MNRYPLWKNILVFGVVLLATVLALPNMFGDDEAVHISRTDGVAVDEATLAQVRSALADGGVEIISAEIEGVAALVRFDTVDEQLQANDVLRDALPNHVVALTLSPRTPPWLRAVGLKPMSLGLDLRGGVHFLYQVDLTTAVQQFLATYETDLRTQLRTANIRNDVRVVGDALQIAILEPSDLDRAEAVIRRLDAGDQLIQLGQLTSRLIIDRGQVDGRTGFIVRLTESAIRERQDFAIQQNTLTLRNRVNELGVAEAVVQRQGLDRILVQLPGVQDPGEAKRVLGSTATLEFHLVDMENDAFEAERRGRAPLGSELQKRRDGSPILLRRDVIASGDQLVDAVASYTNGQPVVQVRLDAGGARKMLDTTVANLGRQMAVLFIEDRPQLVERDGQLVPGEPRREESVINDARINGVFSNRFEISGLTVFEARELALLLRAGSLAAPIVPVEERTIGPTLGQDNIDRGVRAVLVGYVLVVIFIGLWYRVFGMLANLALLANVVMIVALMSLIQAALTLPGIAGVVLTVGMAVDANVLIFERIREELANGNSPQASIRSGWEKAYSTIVDSNLTTLIAAIVLFMFGTGPIKGFAVTLSIGIVTSMFTAITVTRALVNLVYGGRANLKTLSIGGRRVPLAGGKLPVST
ncbi:MAG TPA: protein translocase subunit SecD [Vicinamibacterales bacterium]|nr:protein translocase subunit SecD [Vicinamibacterales bacterium]